MAREQRDDRAAGLNTLGVLTALRTPGDEYALTQTLAAFAEADPGFAARLAAVFIDAAPYLDKELREALPAQVRCTAEEPLYEGERYLGPVDLMFEDAEWALLVENKLYSSYGWTQLDRYHRGGGALSRARWGLLAVTRNDPDPGREPAPGTPGWLGSVRWRDVVAPLRDLVPSEAELALLWQVFLDVETDNGDFGMIQIDPAIVRGWATWRDGRDQLATLLRDLMDPSLEALTSYLPEGRSHAWHQHVSGTGLWAHAGSIYARFRIPREGPDRLQIEFYSDDGDLTFWVSALMEDLDALPSEAQEAYRASAQQLCGEGFEADEEALWYVGQPHPEVTWLREDGNECARILRRFVDEDIARLAAAGLFDQQFDSERSAGI